MVRGTKGKGSPKKTFGALIGIYRIGVNLLVRKGNFTRFNWAKEVVKLRLGNLTGLGGVPFCKGRVKGLNLDVVHY